MAAVEDVAIDINELDKHKLPPRPGKYGDYVYRFTPVEHEPPIGSNLLMHWYHNPYDCRTGVSACLELIPKICNAKFCVKERQAGTKGWGIHLVEATNWLKLCIVGLILFTSSIIFGIVWSIWRNDIQGGFAITSATGVLFTFVMGIIQAAIERP